MSTQTPPEPPVASDLGRALIDAAAGLDPLAARSTLRRRFPAATDDLIRAATVQAELAARAHARFGSAADEVLWSTNGLEQSSRPAVSRYRAASLAAAGVATVADLTCGLGLDALAFASAGMSVVAVEQDPATAALAAANARRLGHDRVEVVTGSCVDPAVLDQVRTVDAWFVDPSRRTAHRHADGRHVRLDDPDSWSPPWSWVLAQAARVGRADGPAVLMAKAAPGLPHDAIVAVPGCTVTAEWISHDGRLVETCATWRARRPGDPDAGAPRRSAVLLDATGGVLIRVEQAQPDPTGTDTWAPPAAGAYLHDPDPAIVRAHLVAEFAAAAGAVLIDPHLAFLTSHAPLPEPWRPAARSWLILDAGPYDARRLRATCAEHDITDVDVAGRGRKLDVARVRRDLGLSSARRAGNGGRHATLAVMALGDRRTTGVCLCLRT